MTLHIYDTLTRKKRLFEPNVQGNVSIYVCGMTVYDYCHIGHARSLLAFDMVVKYLRFSGKKVNFVRNITDIDDKIINRANEQGEDWQALVARFITAMHEDERALGIDSPTHEPRATEHIPHMISIIESLIDKGVAYVSDTGDVCFSVESYEDYGQLSGRTLEDQAAGARIQADRGKRNPLDFVLWKPVKPGEPAWDSPWGSGRPGWHIECSAMSKALLGLPFDIHGGGMDLKFPHHENERAQTEASDCCGFANYWMHSGLLTIEGEKMSKSLGNFITIRDALKEYSGELIRYFAFSSHYGSPIDFSKAQFAQCRRSLSRLYTALQGLPEQAYVADAQSDVYVTDFCAAMDDDFNTPEAYAVLFRCAKAINKAKDDNALDQAARLAAVLRHLGGVLGLLQADPDVFLRGSDETIDAAWVETMIEQRSLAKAKKEWAKADAIRDELQAMGIVLEDKSGVTQWRVDS